MVRQGSVVLALLLSLPVAGSAQDAGTLSSGAESSQGVGEVQIGAGSTGAVTTGASGPSHAANPAIDSLPPEFDIRPPSDPFLGPGQLPINAPDRLRCDQIGAEKARARCEGKAR